MSSFEHFSVDSPTGLGKWLTAKTVRQQFSYLLPCLPASRDIAILEIGPGRGEFAALFLDAGYRNYAIIEPDEGLRAVCEKLPIRRSYSSPIPPLPVGNATQDLVIMCDVFEHMNDTAMAVAVIAEIKRVLIPGGMVFILCPDFMHWKEEFFNCDFSHSNPTTVRRTSQLFQNEGIETVSFAYHYTFLSGWLGLLIGAAVKLATSPFKALGARNTSRIYRLRLCFLRRFLILGKARS